MATISIAKRAPLPARTMPSPAMSRSAIPGLQVALLPLAAAVVFSYVAFYPLLRPAGEWPLVIVTFLATWFLLPMPPRLLRANLFIFFTFYTAIFVLSLFGAMPKAWTHYHDNFAGFRHWVWFPIAIIFTSFFYKVFRVHFGLIARYALPIGLLALAASRLARYYSTLKLDDDARYSLYTLNNDTMLVFFLATITLFASRTNIFLKLAILGGLMAFSSSAQSELGAILLAILLFVPAPKLMARVLFVSLVIFVLVAPLYMKPLALIDANTGVRALFWHDTWRALQETHGLGVGFGTEYITNRFTEIFKSEEWRIIVERDPGRLFVGTHDTFYDVALRTGVIGAALFAIWFYDVIRFGDVKLGRNEKLYTGVAILLCLSAFVNMGFTALNFVLGNSLCVALLLYLKDTPPSSRRRAQPADPTRPPRIQAARMMSPHR